MKNLSAMEQYETELQQFPADMLTEALYELAGQKTETGHLSVSADFIRKIAKEMELKNRLITIMKPKAEYFDKQVDHIVQSHRCDALTPESGGTITVADELGNDVEVT